MRRVNHKGTTPPPQRHVRRYVITDVGLFGVNGRVLSSVMSVVPPIPMAGLVCPRMTSEPASDKERGKALATLMIEVLAASLSTLSDQVPGLQSRQRPRLGD
jgi:hypothetical protein